LSVFRFDDPFMVWQSPLRGAMKGGGRGGEKKTAPGKILVLGTDKAMHFTWEPERKKKRGKGLGQKVCTPTT